MKNMIPYLFPPFLLLLNLLSIIFFVKASETEALCKFINSTNVQSKLPTWNCSNAINCCSWTGIVCDGTGNIIELDLNSRSINGRSQFTEFLTKNKFLI